MKHHTTLHDYFTQKKQVENEGMKQGKEKNGKQETGQGNANVNVMATHSYESIQLQNVPVKVKASKGENFESFALLDTGRQRTRIREDFENKLKLNGVKRSIALSTVSTAKEQREPIKVKEVSLTILDDAKENAYTYMQIHHAEKYVDMLKLSKSAKSVEGYHHFKGIKLAHVSTSAVRILVESNAPDAFVQLELRRSTENQLYAVKMVTLWKTSYSK